MSWAAWELTLAFFTGHLITIYGLILQFPLFLKNSYGEGGGTEGEGGLGGAAGTLRKGHMCAGGGAPGHSTGPRPAVPAVPQEQLR